MFRAGSGRVIIGTADGSLHGFEAKGGVADWSIHSWGPIAETQEKFDSDLEPETSDPHSFEQSAHEKAGAGEILDSADRKNCSGDIKLVEIEDSSDRPMLIPSYEAGGGLWMFWPKSLALQKIPYTVNRIVDESPLMDQGYVFHGKKSVKLMAVEPNGGKIRWIHNDDDELASKSRARSNAHMQQDTFLISRIEYTLYTTNAATGKLRSKVKISELSLLSSPDETPKEEDNRVLPFLVAEQTANGEWGVSCLDGMTGALLWRRALPSQAVCGFYWDRQGAAKLPLHSLEEFVEAAMNGAESDSSIVLHTHKDSLFILPVPSTAEYSLRPGQFPNFFGDQSFEKSVALALISSRKLSLQYQTRLEPGADGRWFSSTFEGCGREGRSWRDMAS